jgi:hypothetical protein
MHEPLAHAERRVSPTSGARRRALLPLLGAATAAVVARTPSADAGKDAKKAKKRSRKKCKRQVDPCRASITSLCAAGDCDDEALAGFLACCQSLSGCKAGASLDCFFARVN